MPRKCSVGSCKSNYSSQTEKVDTHGFPIDDPAELERWVNAIPNIFCGNTVQLAFLPPGLRLKIAFNDPYCVTNK